MTRPLLAFLKQGCLWELMCTKFENKFISKLEFFIQKFFDLMNFFWIKNWKKSSNKNYFFSKNISFLFVFCRFSNQKIEKFLIDASIKTNKKMKGRSFDREKNRARKIKKVPFFCRKVKGFYGSPLTKRCVCTPCSL